MADSRQAAPQPGSSAIPLDAVTTPSAARIYDAWLGGKDNFQADRAVAARIAEIAPFVVQGARANRAFLRRAVTHLAAAGVDQFLDLGSGLPGPGNVHEVARRITPRARVVYLDHDPVVVSYARALLACDEAVIAVEGDLDDPAAVLADRHIRRHLDLNRPVGILLVAVLHFLTDPHSPAQIVAALRDAVAPGSHLVLSHVSTPGDDGPVPEGSSAYSGDVEAAARRAAALYSRLVGPFVTRTPAEIASLFDGWDLVPPGVVPASLWRPDRRHRRSSLGIHAGVGRLPEP